MTQSDPAPTALEHARRALDEATARGWHVRLVNGWPQIKAPLATLSPALVDRLHQFADAVAVVLAEVRS